MTALDGFEQLAYRFVIWWGGYFATEQQESQLSTFFLSLDTRKDQIYKILQQESDG